MTSRAVVRMWEGRLVGSDMDVLRGWDSFIVVAETRVHESEVEGGGGGGGGIEGEEDGPGYYNNAGFDQDRSECFTRRQRAGPRCPFFPKLFSDSFLNSNFP